LPEHEPHPFWLPLAVALGQRKDSGPQGRKLGLGV
jgi:hypothetical protein